MKERPILFSAPMVRALLAGTKTQTRRVVKPQPYARADRGSLCLENTIKVGIQFFHFTESGHVRNPHVLCPYGQPGDRLWVRETFVLEWPDMDRPEEEEEFRRWVIPHYAATESKPDLVDQNTERPIGWRPSIYMPRWASRITLELTSVRVERLQDISEEDAKAEGVDASEAVQMKDGSPCYSTTFQKLWRNLNGIDNPAAWESNPWVWVLSFKRIASAERAA